jgi:hypothetical protein
MRDAAESSIKEAYETCPGSMENTNRPLQIGPAHVGVRPRQGNIGIKLPTPSHDNSAGHASARGSLGSGRAEGFR